MAALNDSLNTSTISIATTSAPASSSASALQIMSCIYSGVGLGGMLSNLFIFAVLITDSKSLKQSAIMGGITISHLICSFSIGVTGLYRVINPSAQSVQTTTWRCMARIYPGSLPFAFESMGFMLVLVGLERFSVFYFPNWYRVTCTNTYCWKLVGVAYLLAGVSFCSGLYFGVAMQPSAITSFCGYQSMFGQKYYAYFSVVSASGGTIAVLFTLIGFVQGLRQADKLPLASGEAGRHRRQLKLSRSMLTVALSDFCLVVIPNTLYVIFVASPATFPALGNSVFTNFTNILYCLNTMVTLYPYLAFNRGFRSRAFNVIKCGRRETSVAPANNVTLVRTGPA